MQKWLLSGILTLVFLLRTVALSNYPTGFTPDEASFGYDAYSLLKTGKDQWGESWPLTFRSFGDFKLPLYTYLAIPSVAVFGLTEFAVRLPNAIIGTLAVVFTYLMVSELSRKHKILTSWKETSASRFSILSALLLAVSPWHVSLSRGAFEANLTTFFIPLGVWAFYKGLKTPRWMLVAALAFGLNLFTYHSARLFTPLLVSVLILFNSTLLHKRSLSSIRSVVKHKWALLVFLMFLLVSGYTMLSGAGARGADVAIFNPTDRWAAVSDRRYETVLQGVPDEIARTFSNKVTYVWDQFVGGYVSYLSPQFLFTQGAGEWTYGMIPGRGVLYLFELPFILAALWAISKRGPLTEPIKLLLVWVLLAPIPAALAKGPGFAANRAAVMMPAVQILSAYGAIVLWELWKKRVSKSLQSIGLFVYLKTSFAYLTIGLISVIYFLEDYRYHAPVHGAASMLYGRGEAVAFTKKVEEGYREIVFSRSLSEPHIFVAFYKRWDPTDYQGQAQDWLRYEQEGRTFVDQLGEYRLGKYTFRSISNEDLKQKGVLFVGKKNEFPQDIVPIKTINYPNGQPAILVVDPSQQVYAKGN